MESFESIEVKARFKKMNITDNAEMVFMLNPAYGYALPVLSGLVGNSVFVTIDDPQTRMCDEGPSDAEPEYDQPQLPDRVDEIDATWIEEVDGDASDE